MNVYPWKSVPIKIMLKRHILVLPLIFQFEVMLSIFNKKVDLQWVGLENILKAFWL